MPYTLAKFFLWGLLMALAGGIVGWLLRSLKSRGEVARARAVTVDEKELERLRGRVANLEPAVAERDRLRMELADVRGSSAGALGFSSTVDSLIIPDVMENDGDTDGEDAARDAVPPSDEADQTSAAAEAADGGDVSHASTATVAADSVTIGAPASEAPAEEAMAAALDLAAASTVLGKKIKLDDLTVVEGVGPKIAELCSGINVTTWQGLADAEVADLQSMLDAAGSRFQMHKPASWPQQAGLLAAGQWAEFKALTDSLTGGK